MSKDELLALKADLEAIIESQGMVVDDRKLSMLEQVKKALAEIEGGNV